MTAASSFACPSTGRGDVLSRWPTTSALSVEPPADIATEHVLGAAVLHRWRGLLYDSCKLLVLLQLDCLLVNIIANKVVSG